MPYVGALPVLPPPPPATPELDKLRAWLGVPTTVVDDAALLQVTEAELLLQAAAVRYDVDVDGVTSVMTADLLQALYRRVGREIAAKGLPLGLLGLESEFGPARLSRFDAEIERLEGPRRRVVFG